MDFLQGHHMANFLFGTEKSHCCLKTLLCRDNNPSMLSICIAHWAEPTVQVFVRQHLRQAAPL